RGRPKDCSTSSSNPHDGRCYGYWSGAPEKHWTGFISLLGGAAAWPLAARAQQAGRLPTIGVLGGNNATVERASTDVIGYSHRAVRRSATPLTPIQVLIPWRL